MKRPTKKKLWLQKKWQNKIWLLRVCLFITLPLWPIFYMLILLAHAPWAELAGETLDTFQLIWTKFE